MRLVCVCMYVLRTGARERCERGLNVFMKHGSEPISNDYCEIAEELTSCLGWFSDGYALWIFRWVIRRILDDKE